MRTLLLALLMLPMVSQAETVAVKCTISSKSSVCQKRIEDAQNACVNDGVLGDENIEVCVMASLAPSGTKVERNVGMERAK